jgi:hypothetical protein
MGDDHTLIAAAAAAISVPKEAPANSFILHAPLELLARTLLLEHVRPEALEQARTRIEWVAATYEAAGEPVTPPEPIEVASVDDAVDRFVAALGAGELDDVDRLATWLGANVPAADLQRALAGAVAASLAAAAHASILLYLLPRVAGRKDPLGTLLRGPARELARYPDWQLRWFEDPDPEERTSTSLVDALLDVPVLGVPGSDFIFPIMSQAEDSGIAPKLLAGLTGVEPRSARRDLSRVAALSMLQEPPDHAPYGWSHCLTMPQAVIALAGHGTPPRTAVAVAATHVVGFRAALGRNELRGDYAPARLPSIGIAEAIDEGREHAASVAWYAGADEVDGIVAELATRASRHHDAHLAKYTLACLDAAHADPEQQRLYLAAAAALSSWWAQQPADGLF